MSWKSLLTAGLLCIVASPVWAAPTVGVVKGGSVANGHLDANGNWVWRVEISNTNPVPTGSSPLGAELGFKETATNGALISAANANAAEWDKNNPGTAIWGWELPGTGTNGKPDGIQTNCAAGCTVNVPGDDPNAVFSALGSIDFATVGPHPYILVTTKGPSTAASGSRTTSLAMSGAYTGNGRVAEAITGGAANYNIAPATFTRTVAPGDANMTADGVGGAAVGLADLQIVASQLNRFPGVPKFWQNGNFNGAADGTGGAGVGLADLQIVASCLNRTTAACTGALGSGSGGGASLSGGAVPEPATLTLLVLLSGVAACVRRRG
jgi:hypothetical protein